MPVLRIVFFVLFILLQALPVFSAPVRVSDTDYRSFRTLTLDTGLTVLLVQDERAAKAAAAIALPIGNLDDPDSQLGLAHYLEHMLFLGSASYPGPEEYQSFINRNGGRTNAATGYTFTSYMMEVDAPAFAEALQRMADTLAHPLLDPVYADKERNAVHAEMESMKHSDGRRLAMLTLGTMNPEHPVTRFSGGNLETLSDKPGSILQEELVRFHHTWYCAGLMKAALYGPQTLDELEALARSALAVIPNRRATVVPPTVLPVTAAEQGVVFGVRPVREARSITLEFVLPADADSRATKPLEVVASVLGTETENSLVEVLRDKGLVLGLSVGADTTTLRNGAILSLFMQLTETGDARRDEVLATVFAYLDVARRQGIGQEYYDQLKNMMEMEFRYAPISSGFEYVAQAAGIMLRYPVEDVHYGPYRLDYFDRSAVAGVLEALTPANARIFHVGADQPVDREAFFYQTPYSVRHLVEADFRAWAELGERQHLSLPALNPFVPDDFSLVAETAATNPNKIVDRPGLTVWHGGSRYRQEPKAILMARLQSTGFASTLPQTAMQGLLLELLAQTQAGLRYQAAEAGLGLAVSGDEGLVIRIGGFSQHQDDLLLKVLEFLERPVEEEDFERARVEYLRNLANLEKQGLFGQAMGQMRTLLRPLSRDHREVRTAAAEIGLDDFRGYLRDLRRDLRFSVMGFGNVRPDTLKKIASALETYIGTEAGGPLQTGRILPRPGVVADYRRDSVLEDSALVELFLSPQTTSDMKARVLVLEGLLSNRFFSRLRTEEQLGYVATTFPVMFAHAAGIGFGVQSPVQGTAGLAGRFESFYFSALRNLRRLSADEFETVRQGVIASLTKTPDTLDEEFGWLETDLRLGNSRFDSREQTLVALERLTLPEVVRTYETLVLGRAGTRVLVQVQGTRYATQGWAEKPGAVQIRQPEDFHRMMGVQEYQGL